MNCFGTKSWRVPGFGVEARNQDLGLRLGFRVEVRVKDLGLRLGFRSESVRVLGFRLQTWRVPPI